MSKKLVAYFSASGVTAKVTDLLADAVGADIHEIRPKVPYTKADLNWMDKKSRSSIEMADKKIRPEIAESNVRIEEYDVVFLGFPIWWYVAPTIVNTFLERHDFSGKKIVLLGSKLKKNQKMERYNQRQRFFECINVGKLYDGDCSNEMCLKVLKTAVFV